MKLDIKDRVPTLPNRVLVTPEGNGTPYYATITRADEPTQEGTPINKQLLDDMTTAENVQVSDEFAELLQLDSDNKDVENALRVIEDKRYGWENVSFMFKTGSIDGNDLIPNFLRSYNDNVYCLHQQKLHKWNFEEIKWNFICDFPYYDIGLCDFNEETGILCALSSRVRSGATTILSVYNFNTETLEAKTLDTTNIYTANLTTKYTIMASNNTYSNSYDNIAFEHNGTIYVVGVYDSNRNYCCLCKVNMATGKLIYCRQTTPVHTTAHYTYTDCYVIRGKDNKLFIGTTSDNTLNAVRLENLEIDTTNKYDVSYTATGSTIGVQRRERNIIRGKYCWVSSYEGFCIRTFDTKDDSSTITAISGYVRNQISNTGLHGTTIPNASGARIVLYKGYLYVCGFYGSSGHYIGTIRKRFDPTVIDNIEGEV